jgi:peptidoglycan/LPS O-acetylase OafA/YrhL
MITHANNFGLLRFVFAYCVLISHSFALLGGNKDPLERLFGTLSLGEVGVAGFFLLSGYLISKSYHNSPNLASYLKKRALRIYPAFLVAYFLSIVIVAPLAGASLADLTRFDWAHIMGNALLLRPPVVPNVFSGLHYTALNGSMWTISYEFLCYLLVVFIGDKNCSWGRAKFILIASTVLIFLALPDFTGLSKNPPRLVAMFLTGMAFFVWREHIALKSGIAVIAGFLLISGLCFPKIASIAVAGCGGYLIFWFAFLKTPALHKINNENLDLSYGIYLSAWPAQNLCIMYMPSINSGQLILLTTAVCLVLAFLSWHFVERPMLRLKPKPSAKIGSSRMLANDGEVLDYRTP